MRAIIQRCSNASVSIDGITTAKIDNGLLVLVGFKDDDEQKDFDYIIKKILNLRIFKDNLEKMNLSVLDNQLEILIVPNFTLYADSRKGNRPNFSFSCEANKAEKMFEKLVMQFKELYMDSKIKTGVFQANMNVELINSGPITIILDSEKII